MSGGVEGGDASAEIRIEVAGNSARPMAEYTSETRYLQSLGGSGASHGPEFIRSLTRALLVKL